MSEDILKRIQACGTAAARHRWRELALEAANEIARLREERRCVWTDYDGSRDFDTACGEKHSILTGLELYDYCPFCGGLVEQQDACEQEEDKPLPPGPEGDGNG